MTLFPHEPTLATFAELTRWVIWQFPTRSAQNEWFCGAVHPPTAEHGWYPALINPTTHQVQVHGHVPTPFLTPEEAARDLAV